jgi:hypothetical protein
VDKLRIYFSLKSTFILIEHFLDWLIFKVSRMIQIQRIFALVCGVFSAKAVSAFGGMSFRLVGERCVLNICLGVWI